MITLTDIIIRYEAGERTRLQALAELIDFGLARDQAEEVLAMAEKECSAEERELSETLHPIAG